MGRRKGNHVAKLEAGEASMAIIMAHISRVTYASKMYVVVVVDHVDQMAG